MGGTRLPRARPARPGGRDRLPWDRPGARPLPSRPVVPGLARARPRSLPCCSVSPNLPRVRVGVPADFMALGPSRLLALWPGQGLGAQARRPQLRRPPGSGPDSVFRLPSPRRSHQHLLRSLLTQPDREARGAPPARRRLRRPLPARPSNKHLLVRAPAPPSECCPAGFLEGAVGGVWGHGPGTRLVTACCPRCRRA